MIPAGVDAAHRVGRSSRRNARCAVDDGRLRVGRRGGMASGMPLRDVVVSHPRILFVGINPSLRSEEVGHHFAGPGNPFWRLLYAARLVPEPLECSDDGRLAEFGLAITNLVPRATRSASELSDREMEAGREALLGKIARLQPAIIAFVGLTVYQRVFRRPTSGGAGAKPERIAGGQVFVLPNPSGLNASFPGFADKLVWYERLREFSSRLSEGNRRSTARRARRKRGNG